MNIKRTLLTITGLLICVLLIFSWIKHNEGGSVPYPINLGDFLTIGSSTINPATLLEDIRNGKEPIILQPQLDTPDDPPFIMSIGWSQNDYLEIAKAFHKVIWKDDPNEWHLYRALFDTSCENTSSKFEGADLYYYQEFKVDGKRKYSVRNILIQPEYGYIAWGGDTRYPRPLGGWGNIDLENIRSVSAEKALELADQQGGGDFRNKNNNVCYITASIWPWGYKRSDWNVYYSGKTNSEIWIPVK